jgi:hypothetical protein
MTTKDYCMMTLKGWLNTASIESTDPATKARLSQIILSAKDISDGYFAKIEPHYEPVTHQFLLATAELNDGIVAGTTTAKNFDEYISLLVARLQS